MRSLRHITAAAVVGTCLSFTAATAAHANTFTMASCTASQPRNYPFQGENTSWMFATGSCNNGQGMMLWPDGTNGRVLPYGSYARWRLNPPGALRVRRVRGLIRLGQGAGWTSGLYAHGDEYWLYTGAAAAFTPFDVSMNNTDISLLLYCAAAGGCTAGVSSSMRDLEVTLEDPTAPQLSLTGGGLLSGNWVRGDATIAYHATDDSGVQRIDVFVDGQRKAFVASDCDRIVLPACPPSVQDQMSLSTKLFSGDGAHSVTVRATDFSGNIKDASVTVRADNTAPIAPLALGNAAGAWQSTDRFGVHWLNPQQTGGSAPIAGAVWRLCPDATPQLRCIEGSRRGDNLTQIDDLTVPGPGLWRLKLALSDAAGNADLANAAEVTLGFDETPPDVAISLTNPEDPTRLQVSASDDTAPIVRGEVELQRHGSKVWRSAPTSLTASGFDAMIDDEVLASGDYDVRAHAWNAAGLEHSTDKWTTGQTALLTLPLRIATRVRLGAARRRAGNPRARAVLVRRPVISFGRRVRLTGQLVAPGGNALVDVPVQVSSIIETPNAAWRPVAELRTDRTGHFRYVVARGPSRVIRFRYAGTATIRSITRDVPVRVRSSTSMTVSRRHVVNGDSIRFRGKIRGGHLPANKRVELQFFARGHWRTFASTRASRHGRWGYTYRFDGSRGTVRWRFRALITPETGYPYTTGHSRRLTVTVRGLP